MIKHLFHVYNYMFGDWWFIIIIAMISFFQNFYGFIFYCRFCYLKLVKHSNQYYVDNLN